MKCIVVSHSLREMLGALFLLFGSAGLPLANPRKLVGWAEFSELAAGTVLLVGRPVNTNSHGCSRQNVVQDVRLEERYVNNQYCYKEVRREILTFSSKKS